MIDIPSRGVRRRGVAIVASALSALDKAIKYLVNGTLVVMKGLILSTLMICVVVSLVRHRHGAVFNNRGDDYGKH